MMHTTEISSSLLNALKDMTGATRYDFNEAMEGYLPFASTHKLDNWEYHNGEEITELMLRDYNLSPEDYEDETMDRMAYTARKISDAIRGLTGWDKVYLHELEGPAWGSSNGLYLFTCPVSNSTWRTVGIWADCDYEAIEDMEELIRAWGAEDEYSDEEIEHDLELWMSSPAYALIAN